LRPLPLATDEGEPRDRRQASILNERVVDVLTSGRSTQSVSFRYPVAQITAPTAAVDPIANDAVRLKVGSCSLGRKTSWTYSSRSNIASTRTTCFRRRFSQEWKALFTIESCMVRRAKPDPRLRQPTSSKWVEFEDRSTLGRFQRMVEIDPIDDTNERDTERDASRARTKDVAKEPDSLCRVQLGRSYVFFPASHGDGRAAGSAQIAHPVDLAPRAPDPTPA
jgi:hypothetical protein